MARCTAVEIYVAITAQAQVSEYPWNTHGTKLAGFRKAEIATQNIANLPLIHGVKMQTRCAAIEQFLA